MLNSKKVGRKIDINMPNFTKNEILNKESTEISTNAKTANGIKTLYSIIPRTLLK